MATKLWEPGTAPYAEWLKTLTPEERAQHMLERKQRKSMKKAMQEVIEANQAQWIATFNNAAVKLMQKSLEDGDAQAFIAVYDRFVGKPDSNVDVTSNGKTLQAPTIVFASKELDDWEDEQD